jgi:hypothetical protein
MDEWLCAVQIKPTTETMSFPFHLPSLWSSSLLLETLAGACYDSSVFALLQNKSPGEPPDVFPEQRPL